MAREAIAAIDERLEDPDLCYVLVGPKSAETQTKTTHQHQGLEDTRAHEPTTFDATKERDFWSILNDTPATPQSRPVQPLGNNQLSKSATRKRHDPLVNPHAARQDYIIQYAIPIRKQAIGT